MPKAKTRSGPQWRTAPGLGPTSAAAAAAAKDSRGPEPAQRVLAPSRTRPSPHRPESTHDAPATPDPLDEPRSGQGESKSGPDHHVVEQALYTHTATGLLSDDSCVRDESSAAQSDRSCDNGRSDTRARPSPPLDVEPELVAPQIPLSVELPTPPRLNGDGRRRAAPVRPEPGRAAVTRYTDPDTSFSRSVRSLEPISDLEATAFAGQFAADFQSYDQDQPTRRAEVLRPLLADPQACTWGWSGEGRQRADSPQPNRIYRRSDVVVFVEVIVRITPYARACPSPDQHAPEPVETADPPGLLGPSSAPPLADPRWVAGGSSWVRMTVPITRDHDDGRLVVDPHLVPDPSA